MVKAERPFNPILLVAKRSGIAGREIGLPHPVLPLVQQLCQVEGHPSIRGASIPLIAANVTSTESGSARGCSTFAISSAWP